MNTNKPIEKVVELLRRITQAITIHHKDLKIETTGLTRSATITIQAHRADTSRIIGTGGAHFKALALITALAGSKSNVVLTLAKIKLPVVGEPEEHAPFKERREWNRDKVLGLLQDVCRAIFRNDKAVSAQAADGDDAVTNIEVTVAPDENIYVLRKVQPALQELFRAVGNIEGRQITLHIVKEEPARV